MSQGKNCPVIRVAAKYVSKKLPEHCNKPYLRKLQYLETDTTESFLRNIYYYSILRFNVLWYTLEEEIQQNVNLIYDTCNEPLAFLSII